jgi:hypothetical protein
MSSMRNGFAPIHRFRDVNQFRKYSAEWRIVRLTERKVEFAVERIEPVIHRLSQGIGLKDFVRRADFILRFLHCGESAGGKKRENCGAEASDAGTWHEDGTAKNVCVDLVKNRIFLRNTAGVYDAK